MARLRDVCDLDVRRRHADRVLRRGREHLAVCSAYDQKGAREPLKYGQQIQRLMMRECFPVELQGPVPAGELTNTVGSDMRSDAFVRQRIDREETKSLDRLIAALVKGV